MKIKDIVTTTSATLDIPATNVVGLKSIDVDKDINALHLMPLSSYISDSDPENTKALILRLRAATDKLNDKYSAIDESISELVPVTSEDLSNAKLETRADEPMTLQNAIDILKNTYITKDGLQQIISEIYAELWTAVNDMLTTGFQTSMYARQYTGSTQGYDADHPAYNKIVIPD